VAEIGVDRGIFSRKILEHCKPRRLVLVDIDLNRLDADNAEVLGREPVVEMVEGDSAQVLGSFDDESFGWIYIDADHSYGATLRDIRNLVFPGKKQNQDLQTFRIAPRPQHPCCPVDYRSGSRGQSCRG